MVVVLVMAMEVVVVVVMVMVVVVVVVVVVVMEVVEVVVAQPDCLPTLLCVPQAQRSRGLTGFTDRYLNTCPFTQKSKLRRAIQ